VFVEGRFRVKYLALLLVAGLAPLPGPPRDPLTVEMREFAFRPRVIRLAAGRPAILRFVNRGEIAHQFAADILRSSPAELRDAWAYAEVSGLTVLRLQPGASSTLTFRPSRAGRFRFACTIEGHRERGMEGVLEVR
jgi:uncharacterized cupredoxin-like copper-binding protein